MASPLVRCSSCERSWHSATMAEGLRELGSCPRCGGGLLFAGEPTITATRTAPAPETAPHLVLGVPRR